MTTVDRNAYYCMDVKMKHGFQYTMYLKGHAVASMKRFVESLEWTDNVTLRDSSQEEHEEAMSFELDSEISKSAPEPSEKKSKKSKTPIGFSSLDDFFQEEKPKRKKVK